MNSSGVKIVADSWGYALVFATQRGLEGTINNLQGLLEYKTKNNELEGDGNYAVYAMFETVSLPVEDREKICKDLKKGKV